MQSSSEQPLVGEEHCVTTRITAAKETSRAHKFVRNICFINFVKKRYVQKLRFGM